MRTQIVKAELFRVPPRWLFLRLETSDGVVGWGEPVVEGRTDTTEAAVRELLPHVMEVDGSRIEDVWQVLTRGGFYRGGPVFSSAVAGIDQALWDIKGKQLGVPVYELLGGPVRDRLRVYGWVGGDAPAELEQGMAQALARGLTVVKLNASGRLRPIESQGEVQRIVDRAALARQILGPERDFAMDFHGRFSPALARLVMEQLQESAPMFIEEPVVPELAAGSLARLVAATPIPIAVGERAYSRWDFQPLLEAGVAVVQPDVSHAGGISETRRIAAQAETHGALVAPHSPLGPIALAACMQVDTAAPNFLIQEQGIGVHYNEGYDLLDYLMDVSVLDIRDGFMERPTGAGLGIEVDEDAVRAAARTGHNWQTPLWRHEDGSLAEW